MHSLYVLPSYVNGKTHLLLPSVLLLLQVAVNSVWKMWNFRSAFQCLWWGKVSYLEWGIHLRNHPNGWWLDRYYQAFHSCHTMPCHFCHLQRMHNPKYIHYTLCCHTWMGRRTSSHQLCYRLWAFLERGEYQIRYECMYVINGRLYIHWQHNHGFETPGSFVIMKLPWGSLISNKPLTSMLYCTWQFTINYRGVSDRNNDILKPVLIKIMSSEDSCLLACLSMCERESQNTFMASNS